MTKTRNESGDITTDLAEKKEIVETIMLISACL